MAANLKKTCHQPYHRTLYGWLQSLDPHDQTYPALLAMGCVYKHVHVSYTTGHRLGLYTDACLIHYWSSDGSIHRCMSTTQLVIGWVYTHVHVSDRHYWPLSGSVTICMYQTDRHLATGWVYKHVHVSDRQILLAIFWVFKHVHVSDTTGYWLDL